MALVAAAALANTTTADDARPDDAALDRMAPLLDTGEGPVCGANDLRTLRGLRPRVRALWQTTEDGAACAVNDLLDEFDARPRLVNRGPWGYRLEVVPVDAPLATRFAISTSIAVADLLRRGEFRRLRSCARPTCHNVMVDLSKNRSRRYCEGRCGNRAAVSAYRSRLASGVAGRPGPFSRPAAPPGGFEAAGDRDR
ncbi:CGNR zinc finger domain-containing protein [Micromonospora sp. WMMD754]|uniref:CGNR zinc finger domain-containing protein n=1 Tax=unclassified Micromonospora TaxID=2617518 RepID=UPI0020A2F5A2|nr:CGNR zinc finger domain-containing protein [Micromonospora sp. WMMA2032]